MAAVDTVFEQLGKMSVLELVDLKNKIEEGWCEGSRRRGPSSFTPPTRDSLHLDALPVKADVVIAIDTTARPSRRWERRRLSASRIDSGARGAHTRAGPPSFGGLWSPVAQVFRRIRHLNA